MAMAPHRLIRSAVRPFKDVTIDVDLYEVIEPFSFGDQNERLIRLREQDVELVASYILDGSAILHAVSIKHYLHLHGRPGWQRRVTRLRPFCPGTSDDHRMLCALAVVFLESVGKRAEIIHGANVNGHYAGGIADVVASDRSLVVECGTIREDKISRAIRAGESVLVIPYGVGGIVSDERCTAYDGAHNHIGFLFQPSACKVRPPALSTASTVVTDQPGLPVPFIQRNVRPFKDVNILARLPEFVEGDCYDLVRACYGITNATWMNGVELLVASIPHCMPVGWQTHEFEADTPEEQLLALANLFVASIGRKVRVECGRVHVDTIMNTIRDGNEILVVPNVIGGDLVGNVARMKHSTEGVRLAFLFRNEG